MLQHLLRIVLMGILFPTLAFADIRFKATDSLMEASVNDIVGLTLYFENNSDVEFEGNLHYTIPGNITILSSHATQSIQIDAHGKRYLPLKFQVNPDASAGSYELTIQLLDANQTQVGQTKIKLYIHQKRNLQLYLQNNYAIIRFENDSIEANVQLKNLGNQSETIHLVTSIPTAYGSRKFNRKILYIEAGIDTTIQLRYLADKELFYMNQFTLHIVGMYENQDVFGHTTLMVQNASSSRNFDIQSNLSFNWNQRSNMVRFATRNTFHQNPSFNFDANYQFAAANGTMELNTNMYQWGYFENDPIFTNTYVSYHKDKFSVRVGSIIESFEKYMNGRGFKIDYSDTTKNFHLLAGLSDKSYDLLNNYGEFRDGNGYAVFTQFQSGGFTPGSNRKYTGTILYDKDPLENAEGILWSSSIPLITPTLRSRSYWNLDMGVGYKRAIIDSLNRFDDQPGLSLGSNFQVVKGKFYFTSSNFYSSPYYIGNRKGTLTLNQRTGFRWGGTSIWLGYQLFNFKPKSFYETAYQTEFQNQRMDLNFSWSLTPFMSLSVSPYVTTEKNMTLNPNANLQAEWINYKSARISSNLNWRSRNNQHFGNLLLEGGAFDSNVKTFNNETFKGNISYNFRKISTNIQYQQGGNSVYDLFNYQINPSSKIQRLSATLNYNYYTNRKVRASAGLMAYEDSFSGKNFSAMLNSELAIGPKTALFGNLNFVRYENYLFGAQNIVNFQVGVSQSLQKTDKVYKRKTGDINILVYYDYNANGYYDNEDEIALDKSVLIDNILFLTDRNGQINYNKVPHNTYTLKFPMEKGWYAPELTIHLDREKEELQVALQKSGSLKGRIEIIYDPRLSLSTNTELEGYTITARSSTGYVMQTRTDNQGNFLLFLPEGEYTISLNENEFPPYVYTELNKQSIKLVPEQLNELPPFQLKVQERKIEVKRFGSTP